MSFVLAILVLIICLALAAFWGFGEGMATAPQYDHTPRDIAVSGIILAAAIASSHWWMPHIGW